MKRVRAALLVAADQLAALGALLRKRDWLAAAAWAYLVLLPRCLAEPVGSRLDEVAGFRDACERSYNETTWRLNRRANRKLTTIN